MPFMHSRKLFQALQEAGVFSEADGDSVTRFVIDASVGDVMRLYVERIGDHKLAELLPNLLKGVTETTQESVREELRKEISELEWRRDELKYEQDALAKAAI